jgi:hypothetical protein
VSVQAATTPLPRPRAITAPVENDISARTLVVKRPRDGSGYEAFMWRQAWERLRNADERGLYHGDANVRCSVPGHPDLVAALSRLPHPVGQGVPPILRAQGARRRAEDRVWQRPRPATLLPVSAPSS